MKLNDSEWTVMQALWAAGGAATARELHAAVEATTDWSYSTVRTLLSRLAAKEAVAEDRRGKQLVYAPRLPRKDARRSAVRSLLDKAFGGTFGSLVQHIAEEERLSARDREELLRLLERVDAAAAPDTKGGKGER
ncbi:MAG: BlaI/MecI/CopY family transcriptional regulator [Planctomycetota bacterium]